MADKMVVMKKWLDQCERMSNENKKEFYYLILRYGIYGEEANTGNEFFDVLLGQMAEQIDAMQNSYDTMVESANNGGRKKTYDDEEVYALAMQGYTGK